MRMQLERLQRDSDVTIGSLSIDGDFECFVLEDPIREVKGQPVAGWKIPGQTAIPYGTYAVQITRSARFGVDLPLLIGVQGFSGVRIHAGNTTADTEGCLLVGMDRLTKSLGRSRKALEALMPKIAAGLKHGGVTLEIVEWVRP